MNRFALAAIAAVLSLNAFAAPIVGRVNSVSPPAANSSAVVNLPGVPAGDISGGAAYRGAVDANGNVMFCVHPRHIREGVRRWGSCDDGSGYFVLWRDAVPAGRSVVRFEVGSPHVNGMSNYRVYWR